MISSPTTFQPSSFQYCNCLNVRVTITYPDFPPSDETFKPEFQWGWLTTNQGVHVEHSSLSLRHYWNENWIGLRCLNCDLDVYAFDSTDSNDSSEPLHPILFNKNLKSDQEAEQIRQSLCSPNSLAAQTYSPALKIVIYSTSKKTIASLNPLPSTTATKLSDFQNQLDDLIKKYIKRQETAMQLRIEEFREEQQRLLESQVNSAQLEASQLFKVAEANQPLVQSGIRSLFSSNPATSNEIPNVFSSGDSNEVEVTQDPELNNDSDTEDFPLSAPSIPIQQAAGASENLEYLSSSFNEDIFDLDEDYSRSVSSVPIQHVPSASLSSVTESNNFIVGSFAAQGRYFPSNAPKFVPDSPNQLPATQHFEESNNNKPIDVDLSDMVFSSSLPISIHPRKQASLNSRPIPEQPVAFEAPHELASRTFVNDKDQLFGGVPRSVTHRLGI